MGAIYPAAAETSQPANGAEVRRAERGLRADATERFRFRQRRKDEV